MHLLIVEDDARLARTIKRFLEDELFVVDIANDGDTGLEMAFNGGYDGLILDRMLPGLDGVALCRQLRSARNAVPVLMLTGRDAIQDRVSGLNAGADDYLIKPFAFDELLARVRSILRRNLQPDDLAQPTLTVADMILDISRHSVTRHGKPIDLTAKEYALLEYFMRNTGQVLSREQILNHVWEYDYDATSNVVEIYVHYLRSKIDGPFSPKLIQTVRGVGYSLRLEGGR